MGKDFNKQGDLKRKDDELTAMDITEGQVARATAAEQGRAWSFTDTTKRPGLSL